MRCLGSPRNSKLNLTIKIPLICRDYKKYNFAPKFKIES